MIERRDSERLKYLKKREKEEREIMEWGWGLGGLLKVEKGWEREDRIDR